MPDEDRNFDDRRIYPRVSSSFDVNGRIPGLEEVEEILKGLENPDMVTVSASTGKWVRLATVNVSEGGMCVIGSLAELGQKMPEKDERVFLDIEIPDGESPLRAMARVAWVVNAGESKGTLGLEFIKIEVGGVERLRKYVEKYGI